MEIGFRQGIVLLLAAGLSMPAAAEVTFSVARGAAMPDQWVEVPLHFANDGRAVAFSFDLEVSQNSFPAIDLDDCVSGMASTLADCVRDGDRVRILVVDAGLQPLPSGTIGHLALRIPGDAHNGRHFLAIDATSAEVVTADNTAISPALVPGWLDLSGGQTVQRHVGGDGSSTAAYYYDDRPIEISLHSALVAVHSAVTGDAEIEQALNLPPGSTVESFADGWRYLSLPPDASLSDLDAIEQVRQQLDESLGPQAAFPSPVFGANSWPDILFPLQQVAVRFHDAATEQDIEQVFRRLAIEGWSTQQHRYGVRTITPAAGDGLEVLAIANALALAPETDWAEPWFIGFGQGGESDLFRNGFE